MTLTNRNQHEITKYEHYEDLNAKRVIQVDGSGNPISGTNPLPIVSEGDYAIITAIDSVDSNIEYVGKAVPGSSTASAVWKIFRLTDSVTGTVKDYADGNDNFDNIWDNRESLSYS